MFSETVEDGSYEFRYNGSNAPTNFAYSDDVNTYRIVYEGDVYVFHTATNAGCVVQ